MKNTLKKLFVICTSVMMITGCAPADTTATATPSASPKIAEKVENKPVVTLEQEEITITVDGELDPETIVKDIKDSEGDELKYVAYDETAEKHELEEGTYTVDCSDVDITKAGEYKIVVTAKAKGGDTVKKTVKITVEKEKESTSSKSEKTTASTKASGSSKKKSNSDSKKTTTDKKTTASSNSSSKNTTSNSTSNKSTSNSGNTTTASKSNSTTTASNTNKSNSSTSSNTGNISTPSNSNGGSTTAPVCNHDWVAQTSTVHHDAKTHTVNHDATGHYETVVTGQTWVVDVPSVSTVYCAWGDFSYPSSEGWRPFSQHSDETGHGNYSIYNSKEVGHYENTTEQQWVQDSAAWTETVIDQAAYDETVTTGYKCSKCGATK